jgi:hypothetical protein
VVAAPFPELLSLLDLAADASDIAPWVPRDAPGRIWAADTVRGLSRLAPGRYPAEAAFGSRPGFRVTIELGQPATRAAATWSGLEAIAGDLGACPGWLQALRTASGQTVGSWLGLRFAPDRPPRGKLYQEVPAAVPAALGCRFTLPAGMRPELMGWSPEDNTTEIYGRIAQPGAVGLHTVCQAGGVSTPAVMDLLGRLTGRAREEATRLRLGISYRCEPRVPGLSLFVHSGDVAPDNRGVRRRVEALASDLRLRLTAYQKVCAALGVDAEPRPSHGMIALSFGGVREDCVVSLRPSWLE